MALKDKIVLIAGGADNTGLLAAKKFAKEGARLLLCDISQEKLDKAVAELRAMGAEAHSAQYDAGKPEEIERAFAELIKVYNDIDVLINVVGIGGPTAPVQDITIEQWDQVFAIDVRAVFHFIKLAAPYMIKKKEGKIVSMASMSGLHSLANRAPYCAAKIAVVGLTRCLAKELGAHNINVNCVCPSNMDGAHGTMVLQKQADARGITLEECIAKELEPYCLKRRIPMNDVAEMMLFLSDDERSHSITGQDMAVSGGFYV